MHITLLESVTSADVHIYTPEDCRKKINAQGLKQRLLTAWLDPAVHHQDRWDPCGETVIKTGRIPPTSHMSRVILSPLPFLTAVF